MTKNPLGGGVAFLRFLGVARGAIVTDLLAGWFEIVTDRERGVGWGKRLFNKWPLMYELQDKRSKFEEKFLLLCIITCAGVVSMGARSPSLSESCS